MLLLRSPLLEYGPLAKFIDRLVNEDINKTNKTTLAMETALRHLLRVFG